MRGHEPITISQFNGLFDRGDPEEVPSDHFTDCENIRFIGSSAFATRYGIDQYQDVVAPLGNVVRIYNYITSQGSTLLCLTWDGTDGKIYHVIDDTTVFGPILTIAGMIDFAFVPYAGRAYISPFASYTLGDLTIEKGMQNQFLWVYLGLGAAARKAGGTPPVITFANRIVVSDGAAGYTDAGPHVFAVVGETDTGYLSAPIAFTAYSSGAGTAALNFSNIPLFVGTQWVKRHIVSTKKNTTYVPGIHDLTQTYYFIPGATINDNVTTTLVNQSFYDADLLEDASHLIDNYNEIPAGCGLSIYHNRLCLNTTFNDISLILVSAIGEPEAINQVDGLLVVPPDGNPITCTQELRDVLFVGKRAKTVAFVDNDDVPSSWPMTVVDSALGFPVHGIATVLDSGGSSVDYLILASFSGVMIFNGKYSQPELSWKIESYWRGLDKNNFRLISIVNDPITKCIYLTLPTYKMLVGNYANGLDPKGIRWTPWKFDVKVNSIALVNINDLIIAAEGRLIE